MQLALKVLEKKISENIRQKCPNESHVYLGSIIFIYKKRLVVNIK